MEMVAAWGRVTSASPVLGFNTGDNAVTCDKQGLGSLKALICKPPPAGVMIGLRWEWTLCYVMLLIVFLVYSQKLFEGLDLTGCQQYPS